jgi:glucose/arabinose dehydrogenase
MQVSLHPDYADNGWVYLSFVNPMDGGAKGMTKVVRGKLAFPPKGEDGPVRWTEQQTIFECRPEHYLTGPIHFGCKIVFDPPAYPTSNAPKGKPAKRMMYFALGERGRGELAQDLGRPNGKLYRVYDDGTVPGDNPFKDSPYPQIFSYGHRNEQGLAIGLDGRLWETEHGPRGGDELNLIAKGRNYGWPLVSFGINYNDAPLVTPWPELLKPDPKRPGLNKAVPPAAPDHAEGSPEGLVMPAYVWLPSIAASGLDVVRGDAFPGWKGDLLAGGLAGETVQRLRMAVDPATGAAAPTEREEILGGMGRVRDIRVAPDGTIYVALEMPARIVRIVPAGKG